MMTIPASSSSPVSVSASAPYSVEDQLRQVHERIAAACLAAGRSPGSVKLLAVSKTFPAEAVAEARTAGQTAFGENYIQEGVDKIATLRESLKNSAGAGIEWHCIGPIQSNKTRLVAENFDWVHSVDRLKIAQRLSDQRPPELPPLQICLQVNVDGGANKSGITQQELPELALAVAKLPRLSLRGIMSIPEPADGFDAQLALHQQAKAAFDQAAQALSGQTDAQGQPIAWDTLSLGMSGDLEAAIQAGSTLVRVGTAIFGLRPRIVRA